MKSNDREERSQLQKAIHFNRKPLLEGNVIAIDPSSGSRQSLPGYALFSKGRLVRSGVIEVPTKLMRGLNYTPHRLQWISKQLGEMFPDTYDVLIMEGIHFKPNFKTNMKSFQQLNQAIGAFLGGLRWNYIVNIYPWHWKELLSGVYDKQDALDAINIGMAVIRIAREMGASTGSTEERPSNEPSKPERYKETRKTKRTDKEVSKPRSTRSNAKTLKRMRSLRSR